MVIKEAKWNMNLVFRKMIARIRKTFFPTEHDKELERWYLDDCNDSSKTNYDLDSSSLAIDLGGYKGQWASDVFSQYDCRVMVFEPVSTFAKKIEERFTKNPKIKVFNLALGAKRRQDTIFLNKDGSSVYREGGEAEVIQLEDVVDFFCNHKIDCCDLMKINIEGGEFELLPRLIETGLIKKIKNIQIQFHNIAPDSERNMEAICAELAKTHTPIYQYKFVWEGWVLRGAK